MAGTRHSAGQGLCLPVIPALGKTHGWDTKTTQQPATSAYSMVFSDGTLAANKYGAIRFL